MGSVPEHRDADRTPIEHTADESGPLAAAELLASQQRKDDVDMDVDVGGNKRASATVQHEAGRWCVDG